jgi:hypothetical protein
VARARQRRCGLVALSAAAALGAVALAAVALAGFSLAGCSWNATQTGGNSQSNATQPGPDPLVAAALVHLAGTQPRPVEGTVAGYLVDWEVVKTSSAGVERSIAELVVTTDGSLHTIVMPKGAHRLARPGGAFGMLPDKRLGPEPLRAAATRVHAIAVAQAVVDRLRPEYKAADVLIFEYLIRVKCADGTVRQVWVTPGGQIDRGFAGTWLTQWPAR